MLITGKSGRKFTGLLYINWQIADIKAHMVITGKPGVISEKMEVK